MKFGFIAKHRSIWPVAWQCEASGVSRSGFHAWLNRPRSAGALTDEAIMPKVWSSFVGSAVPTGLAGSGEMFWRTAYHAACTRSNG